MIIRHFGTLGRSIVLAIALTVLPTAALAQSSSSPPTDAETTIAVDPTRDAIRFVTDSDYPPFNYYDEDQVLTGFNIDFAHAICVELDVTCDFRAVPWDELLPALRNGDADAAIASIAMTAKTVSEADFTDPYYFTPARFAAKRTATKRDISPAGLEGRRIGVIAGSAHEAYLKALFRDSIVQSYPSHHEARKALQDGQVELLFDDGISLVFWLNGILSKSCCELRGGAFSEPRYFGPGIGIALRKGEYELRTRLNRAIAEIRASGKFEELFLRYFPIRVY